MKITFSGKFAWHGVYVDEDGDETPFVTFADDVDGAVKYSHETLPPHAVIVALEREEIPEDKREIEVDNPALETAMKRSVN